MIGSKRTSLHYRNLLTVTGTPSEIIKSEKERVIELPVWRTAQIEPLDWTNNGRSAISWDPNATVQFVPRYKWGDFETLSYTWGEENLDGKIIIDGKLHNVHRNVEDALRRLRALPETRHGMKYWIDAICINQKDTAERNVEVKRIRDIYQTAWSAVVWLGEESNDSSVACDTISSVAHLDFELQGMMFLPHVEFTCGKLDWQPLLKILKRPYWNRLWIIQELAMNHRNTTFVCGNRIFSRNELREVLWFCQRQSMVIQRLLKTTSDKTMSHENNLFGFFRRISTLLDFNGQTENNQSIDYVLNLTGEALATDTKDRVYGIHGLLPSVLSSRIEPNYNLSVKEIFQDFSKKVAEECGLEVLLSWARARSDPNLPSWCINPSRPYTRNHLQWLRTKQANLNRNFAFRFSNNGEYLLCQGTRLDKIKSTTEHSISSSDIHEQADFEEAIEQPQEDFPNIEDEAMTNALRETLVLGHPGRSRRNASFTVIPWFQYQRNGDTFPRPNLSPELDWGKWELSWDIKKGDTPDGMPENIAKWKNWETFWKFTKAEGYFGAFNKFRKANSTFRVGTHELKSFFPQWWPRLQLYQTEAESLSDANSKEWSQIGDDLMNDLRLSVVSLIDRALSVTEKGHLALVPDTVKAGDIVAIVGCSFPIILRPKGQGYEYIGECYLHGFMNGEAFATGGAFQEDFLLQ